MKHWEYKKLMDLRGDTSEEDLNRYGASGWELVCYVKESGITGFDYYVFKREKSNE